ncbi:hypothetical protein JCM10207_006725 [Rhodosporidiobolus poonsookiae]
MASTWPLRVPPVDRYRRLDLSEASDHSALSHHPGDDPQLQMDDPDPHAHLQLPASEPTVDPDLSAAVGRHLNNKRSSLRPGRNKPRVEVLGIEDDKVERKHTRESDYEVDDDWFGAPKEDDGGVKVSFGKVPKRVSTVLRRRLGGTGRKKTLPVVVVEVDEQDGDDRYDLEADPAGTIACVEAGGAPFGERTSSATTWTDGPLHGSPSQSSESLVSLELPFSAGTSASGTSTPSRQNPYRQIPPQFTALSTLPTLSEMRTLDSTSSSSPGTSIRSPSPSGTPTRTLSIDGRRPQPKRSSSLSHFRANSLRHSIHFPGRSKFLPKKKKAAKPEHQHSHHPLAFDEQVTRALREAGVLQEEEEKVEVDVLWEHQRGLVVFGLPKFSAAALLQVDPPEWCDASLQPSPFTPSDYPCPPYWHWRDSEFLVDMSGDKDEEGWSYAVRFRSRFWRGEAIFPHAFVRRRRWIRLRVYRPQPLVPLSSSRSYNLGGSTSRLDLPLDDGEGDPSAVPLQCSEYTDLRTACASLPLPAARRAAIYAESTFTPPASSSSATTTPSSGQSASALDPRNPFLSYRRLKLEAAACASSASFGSYKLDGNGGGSGALTGGGGGSSPVSPSSLRPWDLPVASSSQAAPQPTPQPQPRSHSPPQLHIQTQLHPAPGTATAPTSATAPAPPPWRDAVREINFRRVVAVLRTYGHIDRRRLDLWRRWLGARRKDVGAARAGEGGGESYGAAAAAAGVSSSASVKGLAAPATVQDKGAAEDGSRPDVEDVWDVIEARLDPLLAQFEYHLTRLAFLRLILALHPCRAAQHRHEGWDASPRQRHERLEERLKERLGWYNEVEGLVREYEGKVPCKEEEKGREGAREGERETPQSLRSRKGKGKSRRA